MDTFRDIIVPLAKQLGCGDYAIEKWRVRGKVPHRWRLPLLDAAKKNRKRLAPDAFEGLDADVKKRRAA